MTEHSKHNKELTENTQPVIYITATPIGNMEDITLRALRILKEVDFLICEDTRVTNKLLKYYNIKNKLICYNDHSNQNTRDKILQQLLKGQSAALVSDAGTPLICDPGFKLIKFLSENGIKITAIPGASSIMCALNLATLPTDKFFFAGFTSNKTVSRRNFFKSIKNIKTTLIFFETANRLQSCLEDIALIFPNCKIAVLRELTKHFEEINCASSKEIIEHYNNKEKIKGEVVIVIDNNGKEQQPTDKEITALLKEKLKIMNLNNAAKEIAKEFGVKKNIVYQLGCKIRC